MLLSIGKNSFNTIVENGNLGIENGNIFFGGSSVPAVGSFDGGIISFDNNKIISPILLSSQYTDLGITKDTEAAVLDTGEVYVELEHRAIY